MPGCGQRLSREYHPCPLLPMISTACVGFHLACALPINMRKRNARCWDVSVLGRVYVTDSRIRSQVGSVVWRAAVREGIHLRCLRALWLMVGT
jgi:hypothetical protein